MYTKRVKSGLAVTEAHLKRMDENLRRAKASSRNGFVEQAIDHYIDYLNAEDSSQYIGELLSAELDRRISHFTREYVDSLFQQCRQEVKQLDSVPNFARICEEESAYRREEELLPLDE